MLNMLCCPLCFCVFKCAQKRMGPSPPPFALIMVRTALDYNPRPVTRRGTQVRRPASNQFAGCSYRAEGERISRLLWVATNHRGDWIRLLFVLTAGDMSRWQLTAVRRVRCLWAAEPVRTVLSTSTDWCICLLFSFSLLIGD
jgi:hypothetical protein